MVGGDPGAHLYCCGCRRAPLVLSILLLLLLTRFVYLVKVPATAAVSSLLASLFPFSCEGGRRRLLLYAAGTVEDLGGERRRGTRREPLHSLYSTLVYLHTHAHIIFSPALHSPSSA